MKTLDNTSDWVSILEQSYGSPFIIFKYSLTCTSSKHALEEIEELDEAIEGKIYKVVVQDSPEVSEAVAHDLELEHETPQVIIVKDGQVVYHNSHGDIERGEMEEEYKRVS